MGDSISVLIDYLNNNPSTLYGLIGLGVVFVYYISAWGLKGGRPVREIMGSGMKIPCELSPGVIRYLRRKGFDYGTFAVSLIEMAARGYLRIHEENGIYSLSRGEAGLDALGPAERAIAGRLDFVRIKEINLRPGNRWIFKKALAAFKNCLKNTYRAQYFTANTPYFLIGLFMALAAAIGAGYYGDLQKTAMFLLILGWMLVWGYTFRFLVFQVKASWNQAKGGAGFRVPALIGFFMSCILGVGVIIVEIFSLSTLAGITGPVNIGTVGLVVLLCLFFQRWLKAYTPAGQEMAGQIAGFRKTLAGNSPGGPDLNVTERTPETLERYFPYALALDVVEGFGKQLDDGLGDYDMPEWYTGPKKGRVRPGEFAVSFGSSFMGAVISMLIASGRD